jgi:hypothetical protein
MAGAVKDIRRSNFVCKVIPHYQYDKLYCDEINIVRLTRFKIVSTQKHMMSVKVCDEKVKIIVCKFRYFVHVCVLQLLEMILSQKLSNLSGTAQKHVFHILEATVTEGV